MATNKDMSPHANYGTVNKHFKDTLTLERDKGFLPYLDGLSTVRVLNPAVYTDGAVNGVTIDRGTDFKNVYIIITSGTITDGNHVFTLQHSTTDFGGSDSAAAFIEGTLPSWTGADDNAITKILYNGALSGARRYLRLVKTSDTCTVGGLLCAVAITGLRSQLSTIEAMDAALTAISSTTYTAARLAVMSKNDKIYALRMSRNADVI